ncbi:hypothetical protein HMPREF0860_2404 [Treponema socranskii subsp. socranskii VPI DR56BR1116 = ATCC 35536]|uniref:Uncharacterized protein n=1 Tax=Treponema socranskii subsp. socranskii VPI DR56BR1116 = ATCC 35536 TaxID=1125725 RepID=A0ABN0P6P0_TRESO|nr:hypothetical protein HMPREF0860_2404 [Treponema socranskii subsp. socranskii VPI DR56BR1116 = ATCC 35536]
MEDSVLCIRCKLSAKIKKAEIILSQRRQYDRSACCGNLPRFTKADIRVIVCV